MKAYHEKVVEEILNLLKDNIELLYDFNDNGLKKLRKFSIEHDHKKYKPLSYEELIYFTKEVLEEINKSEFLYDFRDLE